MKLYINLLEEFKNKQMVYATFGILGSSCIGSVAAMLILMSDAPKGLLLTQLFFVTILCMGFNGAVLAQLKSKIVFNMLLTSLAFSVLIIILNLI